MQLDGDVVVEWKDMSGRANHARRGIDPEKPSRGPFLQRSAMNGKPVVRFDGLDAFFTFQRIPNIRTIFWVLSKSSRALGQHNERFVLGDGELGERSDFHPGTHKTDLIWHSKIASPYVRNGETRLNGKLIDGTMTDFPAVPSVISVVTTGDVRASQISKDRQFKERSWWGDIAEVIIYDVPLSKDARDRVEHYLADKYGIGLVRE
ncbi:MAG: hypothetical protein ABI806_16420 [Candidatus Solibacter sp.]